MIISCSIKRARDGRLDIQTKYAREADDEMKTALTSDEWRRVKQYMETMTEAEAKARGSLLRDISRAASGKTAFAPAQEVSDQIKREALKFCKPAPTVNTEPPT